jgi:NADH-quinone oxidoreductase subunit C
VIAALEPVAERFPEVVWEDSHGQRVARVPNAQWYDFAAAVKEAGFELLSDITAVDWYRSRAERFEVVANLTSISIPARLRIITTAGGENPTVASLVPLWPGANFPEREVYDMFGISFDGHPDMTRILMPDDWEGHPLRKDFGVGSVPVQFKSSPKAV